MAELHDYGGLLLGSRLKRVSESLYSGVDEVYRAHGVTLSSRAFPILFLLRDDGPLGVTELAARLGQSHPAVIQMARKLLAAGMVRETRDRGDERRRLLLLTPRGRAMMGKLEPVWRAISAAVETLATGAGDGFLGALGAIEKRLGERDFAARIDERLRPPKVSVIPYDPRWRADFKRLNVEWLEHYFSVEPIDEQILSDPERHILEPGGRVLLARLGDEIVGTCALIRRPRRSLELSKMAVTERHRGLGIGRQLLGAAIAAFAASGEKTLFLETHHKLATAIALYQANGFVQTPRPKGPVHYQRSDIYMVYRPR